MWRLALAAILSAGIVCPLLAEEVDLVYTADNVIRVLYHITDDSMAHLMLGPNNRDWRTVDVTTVGNRSRVGACPRPATLPRGSRSLRNNSNRQRCGEGLGEGKPAKSLCYCHVWVW